MKKILLATTIVALSAGFASAEIKFTGSAAAGLAKDGKGGTIAKSVKNDAKIHAYSSATLAVEFAGESDNGLTFGANFDMTAGLGYAFADDDGFEKKSGAFGTPEVYVAGAFGKIAFKAEGYNFYDDAHKDLGDVKYTGAFGGVSVGLIADIEGKDASLSLGYTMSGVTLAADYDSFHIYNISAAYTFNSITATVGTNEAHVNSLKLAYAQDAISASVKFASDKSWEIAAGYSANGMAVNAFTNKAKEWKLSGSYDLGGGLSAEAGVNYGKDAFVGVKMAF